MLNELLNKNYQQSKQKQTQKSLSQSRLEAEYQEKREKSLGELNDELLQIEADIYEKSDKEITDKYGHSQLITRFHADNVQDFAGSVSQAIDEELRKSDNFFRLTKK